MVANLTKKNLKSNVAELNALVEQYGRDARIFLLACLLDETDFRTELAPTGGSGGQRGGGGGGGGSGHRDAQKLLLLAHEVTRASTQPDFVSSICTALEGAALVGGGGDDDGGGGDKGSGGKGSGKGGKGGGGGGSHSSTASVERDAVTGALLGGGMIASSTKISEEFLASLCKTLKLSPPQQVALAAGLARILSPPPTSGAGAAAGSAVAGVTAAAGEASKFLRAKVPELAGAGAGGQLPLDALFATLFVLRTMHNEVRRSARRQARQGGVGAAASARAPWSLGSTAAAGLRRRRGVVWVRRGARATMKKHLDSD